MRVETAAAKERDTRVKVRRRRVTLEIIDHTNEPFTIPDQEWMGEMIEEVLRKRFDVVVDDIEVVNAESRDGD